MTDPRTRDVEVAAVLAALAVVAAEQRAVEPVEPVHPPPRSAWATSLRPGPDRWRSP